MDVFTILTILIGILNVVTGQTLKCLECTHILPNTSYVFPGSSSVYTLLQSKFNLACSLEDPYDRNQLAEREIQLRNQGIYIPPPGMWTTITETPCIAINYYNKCNFVFGTVGVELPNYNNQRIYLDMYVRNCESIEPEIQDWCYDRNSQIGNKDLLNFFEDRLGFIGSVRVFSFYGRQCYCSQSGCKPIVSGAERTVVFSIGLLFTIFMAIIL